MRLKNLLLLLFVACLTLKCNESTKSSNDAKTKAKVIRARFHKNGYRKDLLYEIDDSTLFYISFYKDMSFRDSTHLKLKDGDTIIDGKRVFRDIKDKTLSVIHYRNGHMHGVENTYSLETGKIHHIGQWRNGQEFGRWYYFNDQGDTLRIEAYNNQ